MKGLILQKLYSVYTVKGEDNNDYELSLRGSLKRESQLVVGDYVEVNVKDKTIDKLYPRKNMLIRPKIANLDYLVIVTSVLEPTFSYDLAFKYLTYSHAYGIDAIVVITKTDLSDEQIKEIDEVFNSYHVTHFFVSKKDPSSTKDLMEFLRGKTTAFMGQSGVGKSSLLNILDPTFNRSEGSYSQALGRGKHETKEVILFPYNGGYIADTPGFSSLELKLKKPQIAQFFPRFAEFLDKCEFNDCTHTHEKNCQIKRLVESGELNKKGYLCYLKLLEEVDNHRR